MGRYDVQIARGVRLLDWPFWLNLGGLAGVVTFCPFAILRLFALVALVVVVHALGESGALRADRPAPSPSPEEP